MHMKTQSPAEAWWVDPGQQPVSPQPLSLPLLNRTGGENEMEVMGRGKDREITYHLPSQTKQT